MNKKCFFALIFTVVLLAACQSQPQDKAATLTPITVQLAWTHQAQFGGMYAADQMGYYADEGLDVSFLEGGADIDKFTPVIDGTAQFGVGGAAELILARAEEKPVKAIATVYRISPVVFISLAEKGITRPEDLIGKTIRVSPNVAPTLHALMANIGVSPDQYTAVNLPSDLEYFSTGEVPVWGVFINSIVVAIQQAGYELNIIYPHDYGVHFYADTIFTTDDRITNDPDLVTRFLRATLKGWTYAVENPTEVPAFVQAYNAQADLAVEEARMLKNIPLVHTGEDQIGWMRPEVWQGMTETLRQQDILRTPLDVREVYSMKFLQELYGGDQ